MDGNKIFLDLEKNNVVVFLDILGFSNKICEIAKYQDEIETAMDKQISTSCICNLPNIYNIVVNIDNSEDIQKEKRLKFMWVSDSIVLISKYENIGLILDSVASISRLLLTFNMLIRGGMSCGDIHYKDNVVGVPYIEAVQLEKEAKYPRVLISKENYKILKPYLKNSEYQFMYDFFKKAELDEYWEFDFIEYNICGGVSKNFSIITLDSYIELFKKESKSLYYSNDSTENDRILDKYIWLGKKLIDIVNKYSEKIDNIVMPSSKFRFNNSKELIVDIEKYINTL